MKATFINAYIAKDGHKFVVINLDNKESVIVNEALLAYACKNAKPVKEK